MLLTVTGVKSGRRYTFPVGYARSGGTLYTGTEGHWARNLNDGARVDFTLNGVHRLGTAEVIDDVEGMTEAYRIICVASH